MPESGPITVHFENSQPILRVESMEASLRFYLDLLGFRNADWAAMTLPASAATMRLSTCAGATRGAAAHGSGSVWKTPRNSMMN